MVFDRVCAINPEPYVVLHVLLKSIIIKGNSFLIILNKNQILAMLHYVSSFLELSTKIQPTIDLSPNINSVSFKDINSTGKFLF